jgi:hypothetical protein
LLFSRCPSAVSWAVVSIGIGVAVKASSWLPIAHVRKEVLELPPALANLNPTPTIILVAGMTFDVASRFHARPRLIRRGILILPRVPVLEMILPC